jgi:hypothetical protein
MNKFRLMDTALRALVLTGAVYIGSAWADPNEQVRYMDLDTGPGSAQPHLSRGPEGNIVLSWLEPHGEVSLLRFARLDHQDWSPPHTVAEGNDWFINWADFPSVVPVSESLWAAHWLRKRPGGVYSYDVNVAISNDQGKSWSAGIMPHRDDTATEHGFASLFPWQEGVGVVWLDGRNTQPEGAEHQHDGVGGMTLRSAVIAEDGNLLSETEMDGLVCDCCSTDVAIATEGPVAVYRNRSDTEIRDIYVARSENLQWLEGQPVADDGWEIDGCPVNGPAIAARGNDVAIAWFTMAGDLPQVRFARSGDGARTFGQVLDIDKDSAMGRVGVAILPDGHAAVSWLDTGVTKDGEIKVQLVTPTGELGPQYRVAQTKLSRPAGFPQLVVDRGDLILAWTDTSGEQTRIQTARITLSY